MVLKPLCKNVIFWPQYGPTCWFNAVLIAVFYSQYSRNLLYKISSSWDKSVELYKILKFVLKHKYLKSKNPEKDFKFFDVMRPERILSMIHKINPQYATENMGNDGGSFEIIIPNIYKLLNVKCLMFELRKEGLFYDYRNDISIDNHKINFMNKEYINEKLSKIKNPDIIILNINNLNKNSSQGSKELQDLKSKLYKNRIEYYKILSPNNLSTLNDTVNYNDDEYILDSIIIDNWNININKNIGGHAIAGITCDNKKYVYNGWTRFSTDPAIKKYEKDQMTILRPCELMEYEWHPNNKNSFCLNTSKCSLPKTLKYKKDLCFSFGYGNRTLVYVRKNSLPNKILTDSSPKEYLSYSRYNSDNSASPSTKKIKKCNSEQERNPDSGRCRKKCNSEQERNPDTGRCRKKCNSEQERNPDTGRCRKVQIK